MKDVITIGKSLVPIEQIALVEPFDPAANPEFKPEREFKSRVVLLNRDAVLAEFAPQEFAVEHGFRLLADDCTAVSPMTAFRVERFTPTASFSPQKPYATRLKWRDQEGNEQSKLLLSNPEVVVALALRGEPERPEQQKRPPRRTRRNARRPELVRA